MNITGNMGLTVWDLITDDFDYGQLEDNWIAVDQHDHTDERGVQVPTAGIVNAAITTAKLGLLSVATQNLQLSSVTTDIIADEAVGTEQIQSYAVTPEQVESLSLTFEQMDPAIVPLGSTMMWWRPPGSAAVPGGVWEIMDGRAWNGITNAWNLTSGNIPNMINSFAMGTGTTSGVGIGATGGASSVDLAHAHNVLAHAHDTPTHSHPISVDGSHLHTLAGGLTPGYRQNAIADTVATLSGWPNGGAVNVSSYSLYLEGFANSAWFNDYFAEVDNGAFHALDGPTPLDAAGSHDHTGSTARNADFSTYPATSTTDVQLGTADTTPPYVGLCFIMKCRNW